MRGLSCVATVVILALVSGQVAAAQPGPWLALLMRQESVRKELKLTDEQIKKLDERMKRADERKDELRRLPLEERAKKSRELAKEDQKDVKALEEILNPAQIKRLNQISYQTNLTAMLDPEVAKALGLSDDQRQQFRKMTGDIAAQAAQALGLPDDELRKMLERLREANDKETDKLLTDKQKAAWRNLQGEPFKGELRYPWSKKKQ